MNILEIESLTKKYPDFLLNNVSFSLDKGRIMGFVGRNGAGKTTVLKSMMNIVHPESGTIRFFGKDMSSNEKEIKQRIGYSGGQISYYSHKKIKLISSVTKRFYPAWDDDAYQKYLDLFSINEEKSPSELSEGMKVKLNLALSLSHHAELLILDEPTSGLDPISRSEICDIFTYLRKQGVSLLFSTHIISDLERCSDDITYIQKGNIVYSGTVSDFINGHGNESLEDIIIEKEREERNERFSC